MIGAIAGDIIGSRFEWNNIKTTEFELFTEKSVITDDSVMSIALADSILTGVPYDKKMREWGNKYPFLGYGGSFRSWLVSKEMGPYNSWGNGSAMRVSPVGFAYDNMDDILKYAKISADYTHNHPEGIKGAQATAAVIFMARNSASKREIKEFVVNNFGYNLERTTKDIRPVYKFDVSCQGTVPEAIICLLESNDFESCMRLAISLGGDSDTLACIAGGMAQAYYGGVPQYIVEETRKRLQGEMLIVLDEFYKKFNVK